MEDKSKEPLLQNKFISTDLDTLGFDLSAGEKWIYPENFSRREYQFSIVQTALFNNTLVCLPTGLGKTFIAAVIMYNFWRWYPKGRIVFLAPTKPLVGQQIDACNGIMGIPCDETIELTGTVNKNKRKQAWIEKRVIFATPQTFQKDLQNEYVPFELIKCIVIDEAHKALGKHSYCEIIRILNEKTKYFRILALSATPGSRIDHVRQVIQNLNIAELELRDDSSPDILPYVNDRSIEKIIVHLSQELKDYKEKYINIMDRHLRLLVKNKILHGDLNNVSKGKIFMLLKQFENPVKKSSNHGIIIKTLNILVTMFHAFELLTKHGLRAFYNFYSNHSTKFWFKEEGELQLLLEDIIKYIGSLPTIEPSIDGIIPNIADNIIFGHNKFYKLSDLLVDHFKSFSENNQSTRAIVFIEYRDIVNEAYVLLLQKRPLIRPQMLVGRAGFNQKQQSSALEDFRNNKANVLISTSVGEEGLDVGEVDLIVCFDVSSTTPIRLVQRMGRTGRKRNGRVVVLLTQGHEEAVFHQAVLKKNDLNNKILQSGNVSSSLYESSPRMVPADIIPECLPIFIKIQSTAQNTNKNKLKPPTEKKQRKNKKDAASVNNDTSAPASSLPRAVNNTKSSTSSQSIMLKFLADQSERNSKSKWNCDNDSGILSEEYQIIDNTCNSENPYRLLKHEDVRLITSDSHSLEFLTLCALKKSEQDNPTVNRDLIKIDKTLIPVHSSVDIFHDYHIPSLDMVVLEGMKDLAFNAESLENENENNLSHENESVFSWNANDVDSKSDNLDRAFGDSEYSMSMHAENNLEDIDDKVEEVIESDLFDKDFSISELKESETFDRTIAKNDGREILTSELFRETMSPATDDLKRYYRTEEVAERMIDLSENTCKDAFDVVAESVAKSPSQETKASATVEVDFQNILDEHTDSEESQSLINNKFHQADIFTELLDGTSSEADMFDCSYTEDNNITILANTVANRQASGAAAATLTSKHTAKRSASNSPKQKSTKKKQKLADADSSDSESIIIIPGTPQKTIETKSTLCCNRNRSSMGENDSWDSNQDLFDDLDFDTEFSCPVKDTLPRDVDDDAGDNITVLNIRETDDDDDDDDEQKEGIFNGHLRKTEAINAIPAQNSMLKEDVMEFKRERDRDELALEELSLLEKSPSLYDSRHKQRQSSKGRGHSLPRLKNESSGSFKKQSIMDLSDLNLDDWNNDFDFVSVKKSDDSPSFSGAYNSATKKLSSFPVDIKKLNSSVDDDDDDDDDDDNNKQTCAIALADNGNESSNAERAKKPKLNLFKLKRNAIGRPDNDKEHFVFPNDAKPNCMSKMSEFVSSREIKRDPNRTKEITLSDYRNDKKKKKIYELYKRTGESNDTRVGKKNKAKPKRVENKFIDYEAEVSSTSDETLYGSSDDDKDLTNFISYSQDQTDVVDMEAHYLQTLNNKSPVKSGAFVFKPLKTVKSDCEIFSQMPSQADNTYVNDSFCVGDETHLSDYLSDDFANNSVLEDIELHLEDKRKNEKKKKKKKKMKLILKDRMKQGSGKNNVKNNEDNIDISSSEDETEILRKQILEESLLLKKLDS